MLCLRIAHGTNNSVGKLYTIALPQRRSEASNKKVSRRKMRTIVQTWTFPTH